MKHRTIINSLLLLLTATIWGVAFVAQSVGMDYVGPFAFNGVRSILGGLVLLPVIYLMSRGKNSKQDKGQAIASDSSSPQDFTPNNSKTLILGGILCGICLFLASSFQQFGIQYTTVGKAGFITAFYIVLVPVIGIFLRKKTTPLVWVSVVLALWGLYLLCMNESFSIARGDFYLFISAFLFSAHILVIDYFSPKVEGVKMACIQFFVCGLLSLLCMLLFERETTFAAIQAAWLPILYAGVMSCGVAYTLQIVGQKGLNPTVASLLMSMESCISVLAGWIILGQALSQREITGCVLMFAAIILAQIPVKLPSRASSPSKSK